MAKSMCVSKLGISLIVGLLFASISQAQQRIHPENAPGSRIPTKTATATVPRMIRVSAVFQPADGSPSAQVEGATVAIYSSEVGGTPLWQETLNLTRGADGRFTALIGSTTNDGMPIDLFTAVEPRWLGIQFNRAGEVEQPRVQLASVPYALRATDAETLGGRPAGDYQLAPAAAATTPGSSVENVATDAALPGKSGKLGSRVTSGTAGYIAQFVNSTDLGNSNIFQNG